MARIAQTGFELGTTAQIGTDNVTGGTISPVTSAPMPRSGNYCLKHLATTTAANMVTVKRIGHVPASEVYYALGAYFSLTGEATNNVAFLRVHDAAGNNQLQIFFENGTLRAVTYTSPGNTYVGLGTGLVTIASSSVAATMGAWHLIEIRYIPHVSAGTLQMWLNGALVIDVSGVRTAFSTGPVIDFELEYVRLNTSGLANTFIAFDDVRVNDTTGTRNNGRCGDEAIRLLVPNAPGDSTQFVRGGADSGANWSQVEEVPPTGTGDYVYSGTSGQMDLYNLTTVAVAAVSAVSVLVQGFNSDGAGGGVYMVTKTPAGQSDGGVQSLTGAPTVYQRTLDADPADGAAWNQTKIDALQVGVKVV